MQEILEDSLSKYRTRHVSILLSHVKMSCVAGMQDPLAQAKCRLPALAPSINEDQIRDVDVFSQLHDGRVPLRSIMRLFWSTRY